jgi:hypothetical protein
MISSSKWKTQAGPEYSEREGEASSGEFACTDIRALLTGQPGEKTTADLLTAHMMSRTDIASTRHHIMAQNAVWGRLDAVRTVVRLQAEVKELRQFRDRYLPLLEEMEAQRQRSEQAVEEFLQRVGAADLEEAEDLLAADYSDEAFGAALRGITEEEWAELDEED